MKIGIFGQFYHEHAEKYIQLILSALQSYNAEVYIEANFLEILKEHKGISSDVKTMDTFTNLDASYDLFFSIGGDGTILKSVTFVGDLGIPIVGINSGRLGFLATLQKENITESIHKIMKRDYSISERSLLSIETEPPNSQFEPLNFALKFAMI